MQNLDVKFGPWFEEAWNLFKNNLGVLAVASLVAALLSVLTLGILLGPMMAGLVIMVLALKDGRIPVPAAGEVFSGFKFFLPTFLFFLVWFILLLVVSAVLSLVPVLGQALSFALGYVVYALLMFAIFLIVDQGMDFWQASLKSINTVKENLWPLLAFGIVANVIGSAGFLICFVGGIFTMPFSACLLAVAYRDIFGRSASSAPVGKPVEPR
jgi:hypothetical protein